jgi:hypothetical protein
MRHDDLSFGRLEDLRSDVSWSAAPLVKQIFLANPASQAEVSYHVIFALVGVDSYHNVLEF